VNPEAGKALAFFAAAGLLGTAALLLGPRVLGLAAGPEGQILTLLKNAEEEEPLAVPIPGSAEPLVKEALLYQRIVVDVSPEERIAEATATVDFEGRLGKTHVASLGLERVRFVWREGEWVPVEGWLPTLAAIVAKLEARRQALEALDLPRLEALAGGSPGAAAGLGDAPEWALLRQMSPRRYRVTAWYIRLERDEVLVSEDFRIVGETPDRPVDEKGTRRLLLKGDGREFFFASGLM